MQQVWKLSFKIPRNDLASATGADGSERSYDSETAFRSALEDAWHLGATEISATFPQGQVLNDAILRKRYDE
jgi:hypothetical protein